MIDFVLNIEAETQIVHFCVFLFIYLLAFLTNRWQISNPYIRKKPSIRNDSILFIAIVFLTIAAYTRGDFFHYAEYVQKGIGEEHLEDVYIWLIYAVNRNYMLWRIVVWGGALLLLYFTISRLKLNKRLFFFVFLICFIHIFNYARVSLACAIYFYGLSFLIKPTQFKFFGYALGVLLIYCCHFFHPSILVLVLLTPLIFIPINRWTTVILILIGLVYTRVAYIYFLDYIANVQNAENIAEIVQLYTKTDRGFLSGISAFFTQILQYGSILVPFYFVTKSIISNREKVDKYIYLLYKIFFGIILISVLMLLFSGTIIFFYRFLNMSIIPCCILIIYSYREGYMSPKAFNICFYWGFINLMYINLYGIYCRLV